MIKPYETKHAVVIENPTVNFETILINNITFDIVKTSDNTEYRECIKDYFFKYKPYIAGKDPYKITLYKDCISLHKFIYLFFTDFKSLKLPLTKFSEEYERTWNKLFNYLRDDLLYIYYKQSKGVESDLISVITNKALSKKIMPFLGEYNPELGFKTYETFSAFLSLRMLKVYKKLINNYITQQIKDTVLFHNHKQDIINIFIENYSKGNIISKDGSMKYTVGYILLTVYVNSQTDKIDDPLLNLLKKYVPPQSHAYETGYEQVKVYADTLINNILLMLALVDSKLDPESFIELKNAFTTLFANNLEDSLDSWPLIIKHFDPKNSHITHTFISSLIHAATILTY